MRRHDPVEIVTIGAGMSASILAAQILPGTRNYGNGLGGAQVHWSAQLWPCVIAASQAPRSC